MTAGRRSDAPGEHDAPETVIRRARSGKVSKAVAQLIVREIADGQLPAGSPLLHEQAMAEKYDVGRASVREALRMLEMGGIVSIRQGVGGGPILIAPTGNEFGELMALYLQLSNTRVGQLVDAVPLMEGIAAFGAATRVAAGQVPGEDINHLVDLADRPIIASSNRSFIEDGTQFHTAIRTMLSNDVLALVMNGVGGLFARRAQRSGSLSLDSHHAAEVTRHHQDIAAAIADGDAAIAMSLMVKHQRHEVESILDADPAVAQELLDWR